MFERRVMKRRPASLTEEEWLKVWHLGKAPRAHFRDRDGRPSPPPDVYDLVVQRQLNDLRWRLEVLCMALSRPATAAERNGLSRCVVNQGELLKPFSEVWEFLTKEQYGDGTKRATGTISLKCTSSGLSMTLTDPSSASYCCLAAASLDDLFLALEIGLKEGSLPWRPSGFTKAKK